MNLSMPATSLLGGDFELIFASDFNGLNSGVFFVRNSKWALQFLEAALTLGDTGSRPDEFGPKWEQATIKHLLAHFPELARRCLTLPQSAMNTYISDYTEGDFVLHLGARPNEERLEILRQLPLLDEPQ